ncbi:MAG: GAF domain-containing sensor histidine kinase [Chloroflexi bacterium]|nr:GAF domain-containing sensor histidine kinase [Chloroflexota bacterium]
MDILNTILSLDPRILITVIGGIAFMLGSGIASIFWFRRDQVRQARAKIQATKRKKIAQVQTQQLDAGRLREISNMLTNLTATLNYNRVLELALDISMQALTSRDDPADRLIGAVLLFSRGDEESANLYIGFSRRLTPSDLPRTFPGMQGLLREVIDEGGAIQSSDIAKDVELGKIMAFQSCRSGYCIPLRHGIDTYGVIVFAHPNEHFFTANNREVLNIIVKQAVVSIQNARLYQDLELEKERMMEIQEEARKKLARDLHDGPTQSIAAIAMRVNFARRLIERDQNAASDELFKIEDLARRTTKEIRHMLFTLRPLVLESKGLTAALQSMAEKMKETYNQNVLLEITQEVVSVLEMDKQGVIFYIIEEAVNNARKHAEAKHIWVRLRPLQQDLALLEIQDDGLGFDVKSVAASYEHRGSLGMINLRERTELINGVLNIDSTPGAGTHIQVAIPLTEEAVDRLRHSV